MTEKKEVSPEVLYRRRAGRFATKIRRQIKTQGLRSGELLLEYWNQPKCSRMSLDKIDLKQEDITEAIRAEIVKYKASLPT